MFNVYKVLLIDMNFKEDFIQQLKYILDENSRQMAEVNLVS